MACGAGVCVCVFGCVFGTVVWFDVDVSGGKLFVKLFVEVVVVVCPDEKVEEFGFDGLADGFERGVLYEVFPGLDVVCRGELCVMWVCVRLDVCEVF